MANDYFKCKQFTIHQGQCAMKVTTDGCLFGAWVARQLSKADQVVNLLDIGSGTGLLSLMLAQQISAAIDAIEIQAADFLQGFENIQQSPWAHRIQVWEGDILEYPIDKKYDVIISNPPFYEGDLKGDHLGRNIAHHNEGLQWEALFATIRARLNPHGLFYILLPSKRINELPVLLNQQELYLHEICWVSATDQHSPFRVMIRGGCMPQPTVSDTLMIKSEGQYTQRFQDLLAPYYLHL